MTTVLVIGDKNLSSWSLRAWIGLRQAGLPFDEIMVRLDRPDTRARILAYSPAGKVPVLIHDGVTVWESLAILEYVAELRPEAGFWPADRAARAEARAIAAEMHAGFAALRRELPMNACARLQATPSAAAQADIDRVVAIWTGCRERHGGAGAFLFGGFGAVDAMFAPVVSRFVTYGVPLPPAAAAYRDAVAALPSYKEWLAGAAAEAG